MSRSKWKFPTMLSIKTFKKKIFIKSRKSIITPFFLDKIVYVHNGKLYNKVLIRTEMVGHKFGEFSPTRKNFTFKKKSKKK